MRYDNSLKEVLCRGYYADRAGEEYKRVFNIPIYHLWAMPEPEKKVREGQLRSERILRALFHDARYDMEDIRNPKKIIEAQNVKQAKAALGLARALLRLMDD